MKIKGVLIEEKAENALRTCLQRIPFLTIEKIVREARDGTGESMFDLVATICLGQKRLRIIAEVKNNGQPRVVRSAISQLKRYCENSSDVYCVFVAPYISPQAAEICINEGVGYLDLAGNCRLSFGEVYIEQRGNPNPYSEKRDLRSLYSPKAERVLRVLLNNPEKFWRFQPLAEETEVSLGQVSNVKTLLENREWLITSNDGFRVKDPDSLLEEWTKNYNFKRNIARNYYTLKTPAEIENDLAEECDRIKVNYAITGFSGAARYAPMVRYQRAMVYVANELDIITSRLSLKEVTSGANVTLLAPYDEGVFYGRRDVDGIQVASPVQIYLDLMNMKGRGEEAASAVLNKVIKQGW
ncbi:MAG: hypothetical protein JW896_06420 [Deltaproteobacteria bacterium]|nr:hypothetical protein [Deltaproteobacteria bacterium]